MRDRTGCKSELGSVGGLNLKCAQRKGRKQNR